jgi:hypothetical protein
VTDSFTYSHLHPADQKHIGVLRKRANHLRKRIAESPKDLTYDKAELSALEWIMGCVAQNNKGG